MPGFGVCYSFADLGPDTYFVPLIRYALSVAGDPASYDVRINDGPSVPGQTGPLFLPFDVAVGRKIVEGVQLSLEVSVPIILDFPVYNFKTELRLERFQSPRNQKAPLDHCYIAFS